MRKELRTFRVDRINKLNVLNERFDFPKDFDAKTYLEETMRWENRYQVVVWMAPEVAAEMRKRASDWMKVSDNPDGSVTVRFDVENFNWATGWVLSWGRLAKALEPPELITLIRESAQALLKQYED